MRPLPAFGLVVVVLALAACGSPAGSGPVTSTAPTDGPSSGAGTGGSGGDAGATSLTITAKASADAPADTWTLTCDPAGGTHPNADAACAALAAATDPFEPTPKDQACTEIYGGPQTATVTGTFKGQPVNASFSRTNGCEIHRWDSLTPLLVLQGGA